MTFGTFLLYFIASSFILQISSELINITYRTIALIRFKKQNSESLKQMNDLLDDLDFKTGDKKWN